MKKILCICLSSTIQRSITFENLQLEHVNRSKKYVQHASGKAINSARVLTQLEKGCCYSICPIGKNNAQLFLDLAQKDELQLDYIEIDGSTRECWTLMDTKAGTTTELVVGEPNEVSEEAAQAAEVKLLKRITERLNDVDAVLLAGSRPQIWSKDLYSAICGISLDAGKVFLADYIGDDLKLTLEKNTIPSIIKINEEEFKDTFGTETTKESITQKSLDLNNIIVVTRGTESTYGANKGEFIEVPSEKVKAINTTACGDSFNSGFLYEFINSGNFEQALKKGTWCAARNAEREAPGSIF